MTEPEFLPFSLRPDVPTISTEHGRKPVGIPDEEGYQAEIRMSDDGLLYIVQVPTDPSEYPIPLRDLTYTEHSPIQVIDEYSAAQLALARLLLGLRWSALNREQLVNGGPLQPSARVYKLLAVTFDWPARGTEAEGQTRAVITEAAPTVYETRGLGTEYDEDTREVFVPDTVTRVYGSATCTLRIEIIFAHKDERAGFRGAIVRALLGGPTRDVGGRMVVVPEYFRSTVRLTIDTAGGVSTPDTPEQAERNHWPILVEVVAEVEVLGLVPAQAMLVPGSSPNVG